MNNKICCSLNILFKALFYYYFNLTNAILSVRKSGVHPWKNQGDDFGETPEAGEWGAALRVALVRQWLSWLMKLGWGVTIWL